MKYTHGIKNYVRPTFNKILQRSTLHKVRRENTIYMIEVNQNVKALVESKMSLRIKKFSTECGFVLDS